MPKPPPKNYQSNIPGEIDSRFNFDGKQIPWYLMLQIDLLLKEPNIAEIFSKLQFLPEANELTGWFTELDLTKIRRIVKYELGCMVQGNYEFNEHKLTFFKRMLFVKESMMKDQEGDVNMDQGNNISQEGEDDDDNGVEEGEMDEELLEEAEQEEDEQIQGQMLNSPKTSTVTKTSLEENPDNFNIKTASFKEVMERIAKQDSETAQYLKEHLQGLIHENSL